MISISSGKIKLENTILDLAALQLRPKATEQDLETYYDDFIAHAEEIGDYFEESAAFDRALRDASKEKRPKLVPRDPKYPFMWAFRTEFMLFDFLRPSERRLHDNYFMSARCLMAIPIKTKPRPRPKQKEDETPLDERLRADIAEKFKQHPGYEAIIEVPNDPTPSEIKSSVFHESSHYLISRYLAETGRTFVDTFTNRDLPQLERYRAEHAMHEKVVELLTDKLLIHDPDAQFENRWPHYSLSSGFRATATVCSGISTGLIFSFSVALPYLLPLVLVPSMVERYAVEKHKLSKKEEILKQIEYPRFKI